MSKIPDIEFENDIFNSDSAFSEPNLDDSDAYLYENMISNLNSNRKNKKSGRKTDYDYNNEYFENYYFKKNKKHRNNKKNIEKIKRNISKEERIKKKLVRNQKIRFSIGSGILPKSMLFEKKNRIKKKIYNLKTENDMDVYKKKTVKDKNQMFKTEKFQRKQDNFLKDKYEKKLKYKSEKLELEKKYKNHQQKLTEKKLKSKRENFLRNKKNIINQKEVWKYVENLSKTSLSEFIKKLNKFYNEKYSQRKHFLTGSTFDNKSDLSLNNNNKNDIENIKKDLDEVKAYISSFKKKQNKNDILNKIKNLADL